MSSPLSRIPPGCKIYKAVVSENELDQTCAVLSGKEYLIINIKFEENVVSILYSKTLGKKQFHTL